LKQTTIIIIKITNGKTLQIVPIMLTKDALSTPLLTKIVNSQQKMMAIIIDGKF